MHSPEDKNKKSFEDYWQESRVIFSRIYATGIRKYFEGLPNLGKAFELEDRSVRCIDEGTPGGIHLAGSGILLSTDEKRAELERILEELRGAGADGVYSHAGCGAAKLYAETVKGDHDPNNAEGYAIEWAQALAKLLQAPYKGHITDLKRPDFHNARIVYYDGSGRFDPFRMREIPDGFIISRYYLDQRYAMEELRIALSIAFGHHGFGDKFTEDSPLIVAPIEKFVTKRRNISLPELEEEARQVASQFGGRVVVEGFKEPERYN